jgi:hypothetical protein
MKMGGMCFNWKVVAGLAAVGVGIWAVAPNLIGAAVPLLLVAFCPLSMVFMMRGMGGGQCANQPQQATPTATAVGQQPAGSLAELKARSVELQSRHEEIAREIARLEAEGSPVVREAEAVARAAGERVRG